MAPRPFIAIFRHSTPLLTVFDRQTFSYFLLLLMRLATESHECVGVCLWLKDSKTRRETWPRTGSATWKKPCLIIILIIRSSLEFLSGDVFGSCTSCKSSPTFLPLFDPCIWTCCDIFLPDRVFLFWFSVVIDMGEDYIISLPPYRPS